MTDNITAQQLEKINALTRKSLTEDEVYIFPVVLCDNDIDRDMERFTVSALNELAVLFIGKTGIFDHSMKSSDQTARIFDTSVEIEPERKNALGEEYCCLKAWAYMMRNDKNSALISEIDGGIKKEVSVGCSISSKTCSICGKEISRESCNHRAGTRYGDKLCHIILDKPTDAYEWSFVAVPAQPAAGIIKSFILTDDSSVRTPDISGITSVLKSSGSDIRLTASEADSLLRYISESEQNRSDAEEYRNELMSDILTLSASAPFTSDFIRKGMSLLGISELKDLRSTLREKNAGGFGTAQLYVPDKGSENNDNSQFRI